MPVSAGWLVVLAAFFGVMVSFGSLLVFTFGTFLKPLSAEFGCIRQAISTAFGCAAITVAICSPALGHLLDRYGPRRVILPCMAIFGAAIASLGLLTPNLFHLYGTFVVLGAVGNGTSQMGYSRAVSTWFDDRRGLALSLVMAGVGVGSMVLPPLSQWIINVHGWRIAYFVLGAAIFVLGMPLTAMFVRERPHKSSASRPVRAGATVAEAVLSLPFWVLIGMLFLSSISVNGFCGA